MCGEKQGKRNNKKRYWGSPPRVRGEAGNGRFIKLLEGITPACAGRRHMRVMIVESEWITPACAGRSTITRAQKNYK